MNINIIEEPCRSKLMYAAVATDYGEIYAACSDIGLIFCGIGLQTLGRLDRLGYSYAPSKDALKVAREIASAIKGHVGDFTFDIHLAHGTDFQRAVWRELAKIERGQTTTYSRIAEAIGRPRAIRAVGSAVGDNPVLYALPCHRVLRSDGKLGGFYYGPEMKLAWLKKEGAIKSHQ